MKRMLLYILVIAMLLSTTAFAATDVQTKTADALNELGLFLGTGKGYELDNNLTRAQGITLLVRMIGKEQEATANTYPMRFTDVPDWAAGHVGYALANGITNGISETQFDPDGTMTDYMFLTLVLRALGYVDKGENAQFSWDKPYALAKQIGLISSEAADRSFTRGEAIVIFWNAMSAKFVGEDMSLAEGLIQQKVFTKLELQLAEDIQAGKVADVERPTGVVGGAVDNGGSEDPDNSGDSGDHAEDNNNADTPLDPDQTPWG